MAPARESLGERIASLEAKLDALNTYTHDKWHDMAQVLQPLALLPERMTRDVAKMEGAFDGKINSISRELERMITSAIDRALDPVTTDLTNLKSKVDELEKHRDSLTGARGLASWVVQTLLTCAIAFAAVFALGHKS